MHALARTVNTELGYLHYEKVAEGFGCRGERVERLAELGPALQRAFAHDGPSVVNVLIDRDAGAAIKKNPLAQMIMFDDLATNLKAQHAFAG
jgi:thiamine pyrophosphate-dependent acetolactate synthase large subunit-like protein